jgi:hypothetical protein
MGFFIIMAGFFGLMGVLYIDFGPIVVGLFISVIGNFVLAIMTLIDIKRTWMPLLLLFAGILVSFLQGK